VRLGTKWPSLEGVWCLVSGNVQADGLAVWVASALAGTYMMSTWSQSAPRAMVREHSAPRSAKSAERMDGAMMALGAMADVESGGRLGERLQRM
jgi:hypothetical protein